MKEEIQLSFKEEGYNIWRRDRVGKGRVGLLVVVHEDVQVVDVQYGNGMAEVICITIKIKGNENRKVVLVYVPPKTRAWKQEEHKEMQRGVIHCLNHMVGNTYETSIVRALTGRKWKFTVVLGHGVKN